MDRKRRDFGGRLWIMKKLSYGRGQSVILKFAYQMKRRDQQGQVLKIYDMHFVLIQLQLKQYVQTPAHQVWTLIYTKAVHNDILLLLLIVIIILMNSLANFKLLLKTRNSNDLYNLHYNLINYYTLDFYLY
ncbi:unnamed protein product [Paramecium octaurelia]|uniref:Transmembrane protein n=1 Tax=Paramecium octaurelia TaxID=43137 RepID=A0A8S1YL45_PAROT|nr:unnamed protein product [Paramecium octaurelia]